MKRVVEQTLIKETSKGIKQQGDINFQELQIEAKKLLDSLRNHLQLYRKKIENMSLKDEISAIYQEMKRDTELTRILIQEAQNFENKVNEFLKRTSFLTYVTEDGDILFYDEIGINQLYSQATKNKGRGNISQSIIQANESYIINDLTKKIQSSALKKRNIYNTAIKRWEQDKIGGLRKHFYYWDWSNKFQLSKKVNSRGRIAEAYVQLVVANQDQINDVNFGLNLLDLCIDIDNIPAVVKGDIVVNSQNGNIHLAVKEGSFSTARLGQYYRLASNILQIEKEISKEDFEKALPKLVNLSKASQNIINKINDVALNEVDNLIKNLTT